MFILPYGTDLSMARAPIVTYAAMLSCVLIFILQISIPSVTENLMYYPQSWNPFTMVTSSLAHAGWFHLLGNLIFFLAFAPALESLLGSKIRYIWIMLFISFVVGISYSISTIIGSSRPLPSLGFSGVVMGMIGLSAWLMPHARIRVFFWGIVFWKTFYVPAWIVAAFYIGLDSWEMMTARDYGSINVVAHVAGGFAGYLYGYIWLKERKLEVREELSDEIKRMKSERNPISPHSRVIAYGKKTPSAQPAAEPVALAPHQQQRENEKNHDQFMGRVYQAVMTHRDSEAILLLLQKHHYRETSSAEFEALFKHIHDWGASRTLLCLGRLIIYKLDAEKRYGRVLVYIEKCQKISPQFILADLSRTTFYAQKALEMNQVEVARNLIRDPVKRYGSMVDIEKCKWLEQCMP